MTTKSKQLKMKQKQLLPGVRMMEVDFAQGTVIVIHDANYKLNGGSEFQIGFKPLPTVKH